MKENNTQMKQLLLIDDNIGTNYFNKKKLERCGCTHEIICATNGAEALELLKNNLKPELILLDINMPVMCGVEFLMTLKESDETKPHVVVMLGTSLPEDKMCHIETYEKLDFIECKMLSNETIQQIEETTKMKLC